MPYVGSIDGLHLLVRVPRMTTVAWDGKQMVADTLSNWSGLKGKVVKAWKLKDGSLLGGSGAYGDILASRIWIEGGQHLEKFPPKYSQDGCTILLVRENCPPQRFENSPYPTTILEPFTAIGSGTDYALGAMAMGADAERAVEVAISFDLNSGGELTVLHF